MDSNITTDTILVEQFRIDNSTVIPISIEQAEAEVQNATVQSGALTFESEEARIAYMQEAYNNAIPR